MRHKEFFKAGAVALLSALLVACGGEDSEIDSKPTPPGSINSPPKISGVPAVVAEVDQPYEFTPAASDPNGDTLTFRIESRPEWATFSPSTGRLSGTPTKTSRARYPRVLISVTDGTAITELPPFDLTVQGLPAANTTPVISGSPATSVAAGNTYAFTPEVVDPDGQTLQFSVSGKPAWATFDPVTGRLTGTPSPADVGTYAGIVISVSDGIASASLPPFSVEVTSGAPPGPTNRPPTISGTPAGAVSVGQAYDFTPTATDPDGQTLTFTIVNRPSWASFDAATGRLSGTPVAGDVGSVAAITITVSDGVATASLPAFSISVVPTNVPPTISGTPPTSVTAGQAYSFTPTAADPDGQTLTFSIVNQPAWASFDASTGRLNGTPTAAQVGSYSNVSISVSDGAARASLAPFTIQVVAANRPPTISGTPPTSVTAGQPYSFTPTASDPDGQTLTFSIANRPPWVIFNPSTGHVSGTPSAAQVGSYVNVTIAVSDGVIQTSLAPFTIVVNEVPNQPPTISGTPPTSVTAGQAYSFTPTATDPDGQTLTFSIANRPPWAIFDAATGRLNGTPAAADVGTYAGIVISVSDGRASASLPSFSLSVQPVRLGSATIRWTPPTTNTDNTPLTNLLGYRIYYGTDLGNLNQVVDIPHAGISSAVIENLAPGTWYFGVRAYNTSNVESDLSGIRSKTIN